MMSFPLTRFFREWAETRRFNALEAAARAIVFYAEDAASWVHFEPIIEQLTGPLDREVCCLTSSSTDPILSNNNEKIRAYYIGDGAIRTSLFLSLRAGVLVTTMPDLETFHLKRSRSQSVHYVYVFHSIISTHMAYRMGAFDNYDTILCVGPHHKREIRATEHRFGLSPKRLIEHGYERLDTLLQRNGRHSATRSAPDRAAKRVLIAPSWGPQGLLETNGLRLTEVILDAGHQVTVRPHPMTRRKQPEVIRQLADRFSRDPGFALETDVGSYQSLADADIMISDWSGAAMEYAFGYERPVLFVDVPRKVNNPSYGEIGCEPLEVGIREEIGEVVSPHDIGSVPERVERLCANRRAFVGRIREARDRSVYNVGSSGAVAGAVIAEIADRVTNQGGNGQ